MYLDRKVEDRQGIQMPKHEEQDMLKNLDAFFKEKGGILSQDEYQMAQRQAPYRLRDIRKSFGYYSVMLEKLKNMQEVELPIEKPVVVAKTAAKKGKKPAAPVDTGKKETDSDDK